MYRGHHIHNTLIIIGVAMGYRRCRCNPERHQIYGRRGGAEFTKGYGTVCMVSLTHLRRWWLEKDNTRKRAIAKALHLEGRTTSRQTYWVFRVCLVWKYCFRTFWTRGGRKLHALTRSRDKLVRKRDIFAVNLCWLLRTLWPWPLSLWPWTSVLAVTCWNSVLNLSEIDQCTPEL